MAKPNIETDAPICLVVNPDQTGGKEFVSSVSQIGIPVEVITSASLSDQIATNVAYLVWFMANDALDFKRLKSLIFKLNQNVVKILLILPVDFYDPNPASQDLYKEIQTIIQSNIDLRVIFHQGIYAGLPGASPTQSEIIVKQLSRGHLPGIDQNSLYPLHVDQFIPVVHGIWFDRGHRGKSVLIRGKSRPGSTLSKTLKQSFDTLKVGEKINSVSLDHWGIDETKEVDEDPARYTDYLKKQVVLTEAKPDPVIKWQSTEDRYMPPDKPRLSSDHPKREVLKTAVVKPKKSYQFLIFIFLIILAALSIGPFITIYAYINNLAQADLSKSGEILEISKQRLNRLDAFISLTPEFLSFEPLVSAKTVLKSKIDAAREKVLVSKSQFELANAARLMVTAAEGDPYEYLQKAKLTLNELYVLQSERGSAKDRQSTNRTRQLVSLIPHLILSDKKMTVMVLLQNNLELRPTGGFIGAVTLLTFDHGKLLTVDNRDIYELDASLKGAVTPPAELTTYLGETNWYFRDSNWSPDFKTSAATANWFLEKEWGSAADVVIGVNLNTLKTILSATGPISLADGQIISADNLLSSAYSYQDVPTVSPDAKKPEFMTLFVKPVIDMLGQADQTKSAPLISALSQVLSNGEMTIVSKDPVVFAEIMAAGWSGSVKFPDCPPNFSKTCSLDTFSLNEANIGINKVNYHVARNQFHQVDLNPNQAKHLHRVSFSNSSPNDTWPAGSYKAFLRFMLPIEAAEINLKLDGQPVQKNEYAIYKSLNRQQVGLAIEVKSQAKNTLEIGYTVPLSNLGSYVLEFQKQPGVPADPIDVNITPPSGGQVGQTTANLNSGQTLSYSGMFDKDLSFGLELSR